MQQEKHLIVNCKDYVRGRLIAQLHKLVKNNYFIHLYNTEQLIITGNMNLLVEKYKRIANAGHNKKGPFLTYNPTTMLRRSIKGMYKTLIKQVRIYEGSQKPDILNAEEYPSATSKLRIRAFYYKQLTNCLLTTK